MQLKELQTIKEVILSRPGKGAGIVILSKKDYMEKMKSVLSDPSKFTFNSTEKEKKNQIETSISKKAR